MGGGILPVAFINNHPYFLFSREALIAKEDPGKWSDFGGSKEGKESYRETAIREGWEESNGFLGTKTIEDLYTLSQLKKHLINPRELLKINNQIHEARNIKEDVFLKAKKIKSLKKKKQLMNLFSLIYYLF